MAEYAEITNGKVSNIIIADSSPGADWVDLANKTIAPIGPDGNAFTDGDGNNLSEEVSVGDSYDSSTQSFTRNAETATADENEARAKVELAESDWTVLNDVGLTSSNVQEWKTYRASLRAIAKNPSAGNKSWPTMPDKEYS